MPGVIEEAVEESREGQRSDLQPGERRVENDWRTYRRQEN